MHAVGAPVRRVAASAAIASVVEAIYVSEPVDGTRHLAMPRPEIDLLVRVGPAAPGGLDAHAFGARQHVHRKVLRGVRRTVAARLRLGAPERVLGAPASAIAGRIVSLPDLWGAAATERLLEQLAAARDALHAAAVLDAAIARRLARAASRGRSLALDAAGLLRDGSSVHAHVNEIADDLGVSERHLRRVFRDAFGVGPKAFARLVRFHRALRAAREDERAGWAAIASAAGYYDQAHLIADFRAIAGTTPRAFLGELREARSHG